MTFRTDFEAFSALEKEILRDPRTPHRKGELFYKFVPKRFIGLSQRAGGSMEGRVIKLTGSLVTTSKGKFISADATLQE